MPGLRFEIGSCVLPGDRLGPSGRRDDGVLSGPGTYVRGGHLYASLVGTLKLVPPAKKSSSADPSGSIGTQSSSPSSQYRAVVVPSRTSNRASIPSTTIPSEYVLAIGDVVLAKVKRIDAMQAVVEIVAVDRSGAAAFDDCGDGGNGNSAAVLLLNRPCEGTIRREDVRTGATEEVRIEECFLPSDWVLCRVASLGDAKRYYLSTASPELGVVYAKPRMLPQRPSSSSTKQEPMIPISWREMQCPITGHKERRKCARPRPVPAPSQQTATTAS